MVSSELMDLVFDAIVAVSQPLSSSNSKVVLLLNWHRDDGERYWPSAQPISRCMIGNVTFDLFLRVFRSLAVGGEGFRVDKWLGDGGGRCLGDVLLIGCVDEERLQQLEVRVQWHPCCYGVTGRH